MRWLGLVALMGCRINFDPLGGGAAASDGNRGDDSMMSAGAGESCTTPRAILVPGMLVGESLAGVMNDLPLGPCAGAGAGVIYWFTAPPGTRMVTISADFDGTLTVARVCPPDTSFNTCANFQGSAPTTVPAPVPTATGYVTINKTGGTGTTFTLTVR